jgi:hypothetical protein
LFVSVPVQITGIDQFRSTLIIHAIIRRVTPMVLIDRQTLQYCDADEIILKDVRHAPNRSFAAVTRAVNMGWCASACVEQQSRCAISAFVACEQALTGVCRVVRQTAILDAAQVALGTNMLQIRDVTSRNSENCSL